MFVYIVLEYVAYYTFILYFQEFDNESSKSDNDMLTFLPDLSSLFYDSTDHLKTIDSDDIDNVCDGMTIVSPVYSKDKHQSSPLPPAVTEKNTHAQPVTDVSTPKTTSVPSSEQYSRRPALSPVSSNLNQGLREQPVTDVSSPKTTSVPSSEQYSRHPALSPVSSNLSQGLPLHIRKIMQSVPLRHLLALKLVDEFFDREILKNSNTHGVRGLLKLDRNKLKDIKGELQTVGQVDFFCCSVKCH